MTIMSRYEDLNLDLDTNTFTGDISKVTDNRSITQSLTNILLTRVGERPFSSAEIGVGLDSMYFTLANLNSPEFIIIKQTMKEKINKFEPRVQYDDAIIENLKTIQDDGIVKLNVSYTVKATNQIDNLRFVIRGN